MVPRVVLDKMRYKIQYSSFLPGDLVNGISANLTTFG